MRTAKKAATRSSSNRVRASPSAQRRAADRRWPPRRSVLPAVPEMALLDIAPDVRCRDESRPTNRRSRLCGTPKSAALSVRTGAVITYPGSSFCQRSRACWKIAAVAPDCIPGTFSMRNAFGRSSSTSRTNSLTSVFLESRTSRVPMWLNPWQGGPPATRSISRSVPSRPRSFSLLRSVTEVQIASPYGKFRSCVATWYPSRSTAKTTSKPACSRPKERPPAPAKKSTAMGRWVYRIWFIGMHGPNCRKRPKPSLDVRHRRSIRQNFVILARAARPALRDNRVHIGGESRRWASSSSDRL